MKPRLPLFVFATITLTVSLLFIALCSVFVTPKLEALKSELHMPTVVVPGIIGSLYCLGDLARDFLGILALASLAFVAAGLLVFLPTPLVAWARRSVVAASLVALFMAFGIGFSVLITGVMILSAQNARSNFYLREFEQFSLRETVEGRFEQFARIAARIDGAKPIPIRSASELPISGQLSRVRGIISALKAIQSPTQRKALLATTVMFQSAIVKSSSYSEDLLPFANQESGQNFADMKAFYEWLEPQLGQGDWKPVTLYRF